jgi:hypothetical protein
MAVDFLNKKAPMILNGYPMDTYWVLRGGNKKNIRAFSKMKHLPSWALYFSKSMSAKFFAKAENLKHPFIL